MKGKIFVDSCACLGIPLTWLVTSEMKTNPCIQELPLRNLEQTSLSNAHFFMEINFNSNLYATDNSTSIENDDNN